MLEGFSLGSYLLLVDYTGRLFRDGKPARALWRSEQARDPPFGHVARQSGAFGNPSFDCCARPYEPILILTT
jgi:hypothetical protein